MMGRSLHDVDEPLLHGELLVLDPLRCWSAYNTHRTHMDQGWCFALTIETCRVLDAVAEGAVEVVVLEEMQLR